MTTPKSAEQLRAHKVALAKGELVPPDEINGPVAFSAPPTLASLRQQREKNARVTEAEAVRPSAQLLAEAAESEAAQMLDKANAAAAAAKAAREAADAEAKAAKATEAKAAKAESKPSAK